MPWGAAIFVAAPMPGSRINRAGERPFLVGGLLLGAIGMGWLALIAKPNLPYWQMVAPLVISGLGMSMTIPAAQSAVMTHVAPQHIGKASGTSRRSASSGARSASPSRSRCSPAPAATSHRRPSATGSAPPWRSARASHWPLP